MAKDTIHDTVKKALIKENWIITHDPFHIEYEELEVFVDLAAEHAPITAEKNGQKIVVEIKTFAGRSFIRELQQALGQYELYFDLLELTGLEYKLYLAISEFVYQDFFLQKGTQTIIQRHQLNLLVVNLEQEEIVKWISPQTIRP
jgi:hypothetical protein